MSSHQRAKCFSRRQQKDGEGRRVTGDSAYRSRTAVELAFLQRRGGVRWVCTTTLDIIVLECYLYGRAETSACKLNKTPTELGQQNLHHNPQPRSQAPQPKG